MHVIAFAILFFFQPLVEWTTGVQHDFGPTPRNYPVIHHFQFRNRGDQPLTIETVRTTCGCTVPEWPQQPILPDSTGQITVTYDARRKGAFRKTIKVYFYEIRQAEKLVVSGRVE